jgi:hypothetical protein
MPHKCKPPSRNLTCWNSPEADVFLCSLVYKHFVISCSTFYLSMALQPFCWTLAAFQLLDHLHSRYDCLDGGSVRRKAATCTHTTAQTQNKHTQTSMPQVGFKPTIPVFQRAKTVHALDHMATVVSSCSTLHILYYLN